MNQLLESFGGTFIWLHSKWSREEDHVFGSTTRVLVDCSLQNIFQSWVWEIHIPWLLCHPGFHINIDQNIWQMFCTQFIKNTKVCGA